MTLRDTEHLKIDSTAPVCLMVPGECMPLALFRTGSTSAQCEHFVAHNLLAAHEQPHEMPTRKYNEVFRALNRRFAPHANLPVNRSGKWLVHMPGLSSPHCCALEFYDARVTMWDFNRSLDIDAVTFEDMLARSIERHGVVFFEDQSNPNVQQSLPAYASLLDLCAGSASTNDSSCRQRSSRQPHARRHAHAEDRLPRSRTLVLLSLAPCVLLRPSNRLVMLGSCCCPIFADIIHWRRDVGRTLHRAVCSGRWCEHCSTSGACQERSTDCSCPPQQLRCRRP